VVPSDNTIRESPEVLLIIHGVGRICWGNIVPRCEYCRTVVVVAAARGQG
jgi:hypothetical protein